jgi:hypothetical protein
MSMGCPATAARMMSGMSRSSAQSPPPTTLPGARAGQPRPPSSAKNDRRNALVTSSEHPFELE